ncbi:antitoxin Xre-like helix-turn-helix domain-containing protein [Luteibacter sp. dw_328]|uniref:antitoxin Xre-like helix-turn-helix domain-containing protein n=1 Tax=Luteibacter sp. dw_328 TaxID=2719796 RepID=UPI001BD451B9|nr:antitoxin Xre-like helix-turn-helix domain-containing protein [Luteibacter sp. dw_328]
MAVSSDITVKYAAYVAVIQATTEERIDRIRRGLPPALVGQLASDLRIPDHNLALYLGLNRANLRRRMADEERLSPQESEAPLAMASLAGSVVMACRQSSVERGIVADPLGWLGRWLRTPLPGLDGRGAPIQYMDVVEGRAVVATWLAAALSPGCPPSV